MARLVPLPGAAWLDARGLRPGWVQVRVFALTFVTVSACSAAPGGPRTD